MSPRASLAALALAGLTAACGDFDPIATAEAGAGVTRHPPAAEVAALATAAVEPAVKPKLEAKDLPCFECHDYEWWAKGPAFPHRKKDHREEGHCNVCHGELGHEGAEVLRDGCAECHEADELAGFPRGDGATPPPPPPSPEPEGAPASPAPSE